MSVSPLTTYPMGLFVDPLQEEFGWSRTLITSGLTVNAVVSVTLAVFVGALIDRYGPRRIAIPGVILFCLFFAGLGLSTGTVAGWLGMWLAVSFSLLMLKPTVWTAAIASRFDRSRGLALAVALSGTGLTAIISPFLTAYLIDYFGWRWAFAGLGGLYLAFVLPIVLLSFYSAGDLDRRRVDQAANLERPVLSGLAVRDALRMPIFWMLALSAFFVMLPATGGLVHFVPILLHGGAEREAAVAAAGLIGISNVIGRLVSGASLDRLNPRIVGSIGFAIPAAAALCLMFVDLQGDAIFAIALLFGLGLGAELEIAAYLSARYFGLRNFGTLFALIGSCIALAAGIGPTLASFSFDRTGSYDIALAVAVGSAMIASLLVLLLPNPYRGGDVTSPEETRTGETPVEE